MRCLRSLLAALLLMAAGTPLYGQARTVTGTVHSMAGESPVAGVSVRLRGSSASVETDAAGAFSIPVPATSTGILVLTHPEYELGEVELLGADSVNVTLVPSVRYNQYGVPVSRIPLEPESRDGILVLESQDGAYRVWFDTRVQMDGAFFLGSPRSPIGNGVEMRRARMAMKSIIARDWYGEIDMDFADSRADLKDAYLMYSGFDGFEIQAGNFKEVFSLETNTTSRYLTFLERPMVTRALTPSRHAGIGVSYARPYLFAAAGVHFQDVGGWEEVENRKDNNQDIGADEGYSITAKVVGIPFYDDAERGLHIGIEGSYRTPKTDDEVGTVRFDTRGISNINRKKYLDTDRMTDVNHTILGGFEAAGYLRGTRVQGEYNLADVHLNGSRPTEHFRGFYVMASQLLFGGRQRYNPSDAEFTQPSLGRSWGDLELALRYEYLDLNSRLDGVMGGAGEGITVGLNYYPIDNVKLMANYGWMNHDRWANARGSLFVGTDENGDPTRDPRLVVERNGDAGEDYSLLAFRVQVTF